MANLEKFLYAANEYVIATRTKKNFKKFEIFAFELLVNFIL
jgi:hypothetical protein